MNWNWNQTDLTVRVTFKVPPSTKQTDLRVEITRESLVAGINGQPPVCQGQLFNPIDPRRSKFSCTDGEVIINLGKLNKAAWSTLFKSDASAAASSKQVICTWTYEAAEPGELSMAEGDIVTVLKEHPSGWWEGELNGTIGFFPENFTKPYEGDQSRPEVGAEAKFGQTHSPTPEADQGYDAGAAQPPRGIAVGGAPAGLMSELAGKLNKTPRTTDAEPPRGDGIRGRGGPPRGGPVLTSSEAEPPRGDGIRGRGGPPRGGPVLTSSEAEPPRGDSTRGRGGPPRGGPVLTSSEPAPPGARGRASPMVRAPMATTYGGHQPVFSQDDTATVSPTVERPRGGGPGGRGAGGGGEFASRGRGSARTTIAFGSGQTPLDQMKGGEFGFSPRSADGPPVGGHPRSGTIGGGGRGAGPPGFIPAATNIGAGGNPPGLTPAAANIGAGGNPPGLRGATAAAAVPVPVFQAPDLQKAHQRAEMMQSEPPPLIRRPQKAAAPEPKPPPEPKGIVQFDYEAEAEGELSLVAGDEILILQKDDSGWWSGTVLRTGVSGWFPADFVAEVSETKATAVLDEITPALKPLDVPRRAGNPGRRLPSRKNRGGAAGSSTTAAAATTGARQPAMTTSDPPPRLQRGQTVSVVTRSDDSELAGPANPVSAPNPLSQAAAAKAGGLRRVNTEALSKMERPPTEQPGFKLPQLRSTQAGRGGAGAAAPHPTATPAIGGHPSEPAGPPPPRPTRRAPVSSQLGVSPLARSGGEPGSSGAATHLPLHVESKPPAPAPPVQKNSWKDFPSFEIFTQDLVEIFNSVARSLGGKLPQHPWLGRQSVDTSLFGLSVVSCQGQIFNFGNHDARFTLEELSYPFVYASLLERSGGAQVHALMGKTPTDQPANAMLLNDDNNPHNPFMNSGAMVMLSQLYPGMDDANRIASYLNDLASLDDSERSPYICCSMPSYIATNVSTDINVALGYWLHAQQKLGSKEVTQQLAFFNQIRAVEMTCSQLASLGVTLANQGRTCRKKAQIFSAATCNDTIDIIRSCGMAAASKSWFSCKGLPCKASISGALLVIIPNIAAIAIYSPLLDSQLNSVRGVQFVMALASKYGSI